MTCESQSCCCCISVRTGTMVLGVLTLLSLFEELNEFLPLRMAANGVAAVAFVLLVLDDTEFKRKLFYYSYSACQCVIYSYTLYRALNGLEQEKPWVDACNQLSRSGDMDKLEVKSISQC